jgi:hypothetical protein
MTVLIKCAGLLAGVSTVAVMGVAIAQSEPPNPLITNPAIGAGQQSPQMTPMGETGVLAPLPEMKTATITREPQVAAVAPAPAPAPEAQPAPEPSAPVAAAPAPEPAPSSTMGAAPETSPEPAPAPMPPRQDRG